MAIRHGKGPQKSDGAQTVASGRLPVEVRGAPVSVNSITDGLPGPPPEAVTVTSLSSPGLAW